MAFNSIEYLLLLAGTWFLFFRVPPAWRIALLIAASLAFYAVWSVPLVSLIVLSALVDYSAGLAIQGAPTLRRRRAWLAVSMCANLGLLAYFKYSNFFIENLLWLADSDSQARVIEIVLPPGISFYTFQTMSYTIDVYRRQMVATRSFLRFFLYVSFFPQLVAGPIERAGHLLDQFAHAAKQRMSTSNLLVGVRMIAWGMFKKVVIADSCGALTDRVFGAPEGFTGWSALIALYAFTLQIYCDFSAYSEIARGSARLFGVDLMRNFDQPYLTTNIRDFWRRWHISLSNWFRDYVYTPLGGSRAGRARVLLNLLITMFLSGLWHGAAWNFVLWGLFHGLLLLLTTLWMRTRAYTSVLAQFGRWGVLAGWFVNFHLVVFGWLLFRVDSVAQVATIARAIAIDLVTALPSAPQVGFLLFAFAFIGMTALERRFALLDRIHRDASATLVFYVAILACTLLLAGSGGPEFIYFQF